MGSLILRTVFICPFFVSAPASGTEGVGSMDAEDLESQILMTELCTDGRGHYVGTSPTPGDEDRGDVVYGTDDRLLWTREEYTRTEGQFFEPRESDMSRNSNLMGIDWRFMSRVSVDSDACTLRCGTREVELQRVDDETVRTLFVQAEFGERTFRRRPVALARNRRGRYYFVDSSDRDGEKDYRVYAGSRGRLKLLKMKNVVEDTEGLIFETTAGTFRLVLEAGKSFWIRGKQSVELVNIPLRENTQFIYTGLGPYSGKALGTPCDIF